jgi:hypothetical protein
MSQYQFRQNCSTGFAFSCIDRTAAIITLMETAAIITQKRTAKEEQLPPLLRRRTSVDLDFFEAHAAVTLLRFQLAKSTSALQS